MRRSPEQVLFDRIARTWLVPAAESRIAASPGRPGIQLRTALVLWRAPNNAPEVYFNEEVQPFLESVELPRIPGVGPGDSFTRSQVSGVIAATLQKAFRNCGHLFILQGRDNLYFLSFSRIQDLADYKEFELLKGRLNEGGVTFGPSDEMMSIYLDVVKNTYDGSASAKRRWALAEQERRVERERAAAAAKVRRYRKLPTFIAHFEPEIQATLREARETYVDGHFVACVALSATTADRICLGLLARYPVDAKVRRALTKATFGVKLTRMKGLGLLDKEQLVTLQRLNKIRNRYLHPNTRVTPIGTARHALQAVKLLHEFFEQTLSAFRDYEIVAGRLVPKTIK